MVKTNTKNERMILKLNLVMILKLTFQHFGAEFYSTLGSDAPLVMLSYKGQLNKVTLLVTRSLIK